MNKSQRLKMITNHNGKPKLVFERWFAKVEFRDGGQHWAKVNYTLTTEKTSFAWGKGATPLKAARDAWKTAKRDFETETRWHRARNWEFYHFDDAVPPNHDIEHRGHKLGLDKDLYYHCSICNQRYRTLDHCGKCPEVPVFHGLWKTAFVRAEEVLGFKPLTKKQLDSEGFQTGGNLPKPCAALEYSENPSGYLFVYNPLDATPKKTMSEAQKAALAKAHEGSQRRYYCQNCHRRHEDHEVGQKHCHRCQMIFWAVKMCEEGFYVLDSETTGLDSYTDEMVQLGILDHEGNELFNRLIRPPDPQAVHIVGHKGRSAFDIHGISAERLENEQPFEAFYEEIVSILSKAKNIIVYNWDYDISMLRRMIEKRGLPELELDGYCAMEHYAQFVGQIRYNRERRGRYSSWSYRWHPLPYGNHSAIGDCRGTLKLIREMAGLEKPEEEENE